MSISKKFSILFAISFILMLTIGFWINNINNKRVDNLVKQKYLKIANELLLNFDNSAKIEEILKNNNLEYANKNNDDTKERFFYKEHTFGFIAIDKKLFADDFLLHINFLDKNLIVETPNEDDINEQYQLNTLIFLAILLLIFIFLYTLRLLSPLKIITAKIENFSKGELGTRIDINSKDEIGTLANSFNNMARTLEDLIKTREDLLRDIGHELRTPITKGKFAIQKIDNFSQKELLKRIFSDLEGLTNELIELEKLNSNQLNYSVFTTETLIVEALNRLYITDEKSIKLEMEKSFKINGDLHYLCLALKNLIDNALKYAQKLPITIRVTKDNITVSNYSNPLSKNLEHYLKPFTQELSNNNGFGLGLSIVNKIVYKHNFTLLYEYKEEQNHFILKYK